MIESSIYYGKVIYDGRRQRDTGRAIVSSQHLDLQAGEIGVLTRAWNAHPTGSPVVAWDGDFVVIDVPAVASC